MARTRGGAHGDQLRVELGHCPSSIAGEAVRCGVGDHVPPVLEVERQRVGGGLEIGKQIELAARRCGKTFEIQVQPLANFLHERELLIRESHAGFKIKRERLRDEVAAQIPLFAFYRDLLRWLFVDPVGRPPRHPGIRVPLEARRLSRRYAFAAAPLAAPCSSTSTLSSRLS
ncbi:MAG: hypothetical protein V3T05_09350 [Myxococcota bacterium]